MTFRRLALVASRAETSISGGQKSYHNPVVSHAGTGRSRTSARRAHVDAYWLKTNMPTLWGNYVRTAFRTREACAAHFEVSYQTVCNWWDGLHAPASAIYARASIEDGARLHATMTGARP